MNQVELSHLLHNPFSGRDFPGELPGFPEKWASTTMAGSLGLKVEICNGPSKHPAMVGNDLQ